MDASQSTLIVRPRFLHARTPRSSTPSVKIHKPCDRCPQTARAGELKQLRIHGMVNAWTDLVEQGGSAAERVGIKGADPKSVRKFAANEAKRAGYDMEEIQDALGHSDISTTQGYVLKSTRRQSVVRLALPEKPKKSV